MRCYAQNRLIVTLTTLVIGSTGPVILVFKLLSQLIKSYSNIYLLINYKFVIMIILHVFNLVLVDSIHIFLLCGDACHVP